MTYDIYITGEITQKSFRSFANKLLTHGHYKVNILLNSDGGDAYAALAYFDLIKNSQKTIFITATGLVASAAVLILAAGQHRHMTTNSWVMVHEDSVAVEEGMNVSQIERDAAHSRRLETQWSEILSSVTNTTVDKWNELHKAETYLNAKECLELGLIDKIVGNGSI